MPARKVPGRCQTNFVQPGEPIPEGMSLLWEPHPIQIRALIAQEDEILFGGAKSGGKTACGIAWLIKGNYTNDQLRPCDATYVNHPYYRGLVLRKNLIDMADWVDKAKRIYEPLGAQFKERPLAFFEFPSGAKIILGHLDDSDTYTKYQGQEFHRFLLEEATLVPDVLSYQMVRSCVRSTLPELKTQTFLTANPGGPGHCVPHGDVLTPFGWVDIRQMRVGDPVYTVTPSGELEESEVEQVHRSRYKGDIVVTTARGLHMECTPNHGIAKVGGRPDQRGRAFTVTPFDELPGQATVLRSVLWMGEAEEKADVEIQRLPGRRKHDQPLKLKACEYGALMGWFLSEGWLVDRDRAFSIAQMKPDGRRRIIALLDRCGFKYSTGATGFTVYSPEWYAHLKALGVGCSRQKFVPAQLKRANRTVIGCMFDALVDGDGHWTSKRGGSGTYYTSSPKLADDVAELAVKLGYVVYQSSRQRENRETRAYEISFKTTRSGGTELLTGQHTYSVSTQTKRRSQIKRVPFDGNVYCIGVPETHTFVIRQNGCVWVSGNSWVRDRFVKPKDKDGNVITPGNRIVDPVTGETRIYIPARVHDNPSILADPSYINKLRGLPDAQKRAFLDGDWDALSGIFFTEFRPNGPLIGETEQARHVIASRHLSPWLHRSIGMDWGYAHDGAAYWGCEVEDGRFHIYREMVAKNRGAEQWGVEIGLASMQDLRGVDGHAMSLFLSPDAWDRRNDTRSVADQIADGIRRVLGSDSVMLATEEEIPGEFAARVEQQRGMGITVRKAPNQRIAGANYLRSQLRWWPLSQMERGTFDQELFMRMLQEDARRAMDYRESFYKMQQSEILPGLLIHDCCPRLIDTLQCVQHDEKRPEDVEKSAGDDCYDAFRYLVFARTKEQAREPFSVFLQRRMEAITAARGGAMDGNVIVQVARKAEADYAGDPGQSSPFFIPRAGGRRAKMAVN